MVMAVPRLDDSAATGAAVPTTALPGSTMTTMTSVPPVSAIPVNGGLMAAASKARPGGNTAWSPAASSATIYNPAGYTAQNAGARGYSASQGHAATYDPTLANRDGTSYNPTTQTVGQNQLVSNQLTDLTRGNSKYIQDARQQALEQSARSGLMTSSIAAGNATRAAIQAALPIAQQDAARFGSVADQNMAATNQAGQFNAGQGLQLSLADAGAANTADQFNANAGNQMTATNLDAANRAAEFGANATNSASQFNANSANQAGAYNAGATNEAGQFNVGQINGINQHNADQWNAITQGQQAQAEQQNQFDRTLNTQQANQFFGSTFQREQQMASVMQSIFENPNLTPAQQQQAADNAKVVMQGLWTATNNTFAAGVPSIFTNP